MDKNTNIREFVLKQLGDDPTEEKIKQVIEKTKISPILIQQWIKFSKKNYNTTEENNSSVYETIPKFNGKFENTNDEYDDIQEDKRINTYKNYMNHNNNEQIKKIDSQQKSIEKEIKQKKKIQKIEKKQQKIIMDDQKELEEIKKQQNNIEDKYINIPVYYMIKLEESLMEQAMNIHQKLVKIIEQRYDYLSLL